MAPEWRYTSVWSAVEGEAGELAEAARSTQDLHGLRPGIDDLGTIVLRYGNAALPDLLGDIATGPLTGSLLLGRRRLLEFLAVRCFESEGIRWVLKESCGLPGPTAREKLSLVSALSSLLACLAHRFGSTDPSSVEVKNAESVIHLMAEIARRDFGIDGGIDIEGALRSFAAVEPALYLWREAYRDHLLHATDVCLLGWLLLDCRFSGSDDNLGRGIGGMLGLNERCLYANWFLAALLHDIGFAADAIRQAADHIDYLKSEYMDELRAQIEAAIEKTVTRIREELLQVSLGLGLEDMDHGVVGYLHVREAIEKAVREPSRQREFDPACLAILKHNLKKVPIAFETEPIAALLLLCDELQEWERPRLSAQMFAARSREATTPAEPSTLFTSKILESLELKGVSLTADGKFAFTGDDLEFCLTYRPPEIARFRPERVCVEKCHNLQRLKPSGFPFPLKLKLVNQYLGGAAKEYGLEALRSYALRRPEAGLVEFVDGGRQGVPVITFQKEPGNIERISFDLEMLNSVPLLPEKLDVDWDDFGRWSLARRDPYALQEEPLLRDDGL